MLRLSHALLSIFIFVSVLQPAESASPSCSSHRLRKEIRDLSTSEWRAYVNAIRSIKASGQWSPFVITHRTYTLDAHGGVLFLAWHRRFLYEFETLLLNLTGPALTGLPYFEPFADYDIFDSSSPRYMGVNTGCVTDGPAAGWTTVVGPCLTRAMTVPTRTIDPRTVASMMLGGSAFAAFANALEIGQHATVHGTIGGDMAGLNTSTEDPMFWLHHGHVDYVWYKRQYFNVQQFYYDYDGQHTPGGIGHVTLNTRVRPWGDTVAHISDVYGTWCYDYQDPARLAGSDASLPNVQAPNLKRETKTNSHRLVDWDPNGPANHFSMPSKELMRSMQIDPANARAAMDNINHHVDLINAEIGQGKRPPTMMELTAGIGGVDLAADKAPAPADDATAPTSSVESTRSDAVRQFRFNYAAYISVLCLVLML